MQFVQPIILTHSPPVTSSFQEVTYTLGNKQIILSRHNENRNPELSV